jgi:hypothetical protein
VYLCHSLLGYQHLRIADDLLPGLLLYEHRGRPMHGDCALLWRPHVRLE